MEKSTKPYIHQILYTKEKLLFELQEVATKLNLPLENGKVLHQWVQENPLHTGVSKVLLDEIIRPMYFKAEDGTAFTFILDLEDTSSARKKIQSLTYNDTQYTLNPTTYFSYWEDTPYSSVDYPFYGIFPELQITVSNGSNTITFSESITFYQ